MKKIFSFLSILVILILIVYSYKKYRIAPSIAFPTLKVVSEKKETVTLEASSGKLRVVSFYASWCPDCKREFPKMQKASETNFKDFEFIAITDEGLEKMIAFRDKYKYPFTFFTLPNDFDNYGIYAIPTTYILNSKNEILYSKVGDMDWESGKLPLMNTDEH